jgi:dihydroorotate dehydrogenase (fumarate)
MAPDAYLEHIRRVKAAVAIPVIASLNGTSAESWLKFARSIEQAGADALELNMYDVVADPAQSAAVVENEIRQIVVDVTQFVSIPIAVKLSPFFTAFTHFARQLDAAGADGLVLFNRFYQPDVDIDAMAVVPRLELSTNAELLLRLRWAATLHDQVHCSLAVTGGVEAPVDGIKAVIAGAHAVQMVSAILRHGPAYFEVMRNGLARWMESRHVESIDEVRGRVDGRGADASVLERGDYIRTLHSWTT